jgi:hypothetical protein
MLSRLLFIYGLHKDAVSSSDHRGSNKWLNRLFIGDVSTAMVIQRQMVYELMIAIR